MNRYNFEVQRMFDDGSFIVEKIDVRTNDINFHYRNRKPYIDFLGIKIPRKPELVVDAKLYGENLIYCKWNGSCDDEIFFHEWFNNIIGNDKASYAVDVYIKDKIYKGVFPIEERFQCSGLLEYVIFSYDI